MEEEEEEEEEEGEGTEKKRRRMKWKEEKNLRDVKNSKGWRGTDGGGNHETESEGGWGWERGIRF